MLDQIEGRETAAEMPPPQGDLSVDRVLAQSMADQHRGQFTQALKRFEHVLELLEMRPHLQIEAQSRVALARLHLRCGRRAAARPLLARAEQIIDQQGLCDPGPLPSVYRMLIGDLTLADPPMLDKAPVLIQAEARLVLHRIDPRAGHLSRAGECLELLSSHLDGDDLDRFWRNNPVARMHNRLADRAVPPRHSGLTSR